MSTSSTRYGRAKNAGKSESVTERLNNGVETAEHEAAEMAETVKRSAGELAETVSTKLKTVGVDTDVMANAAKDQVSELQRIVADELQAHPMRALGIAAAVGVFVGLMTAR